MSSKLRKVDFTTRSMIKMSKKSEKADQAAEIYKKEKEAAWHTKKANIATTRKKLWDASKAKEQQLIRDKEQANMEEEKRRKNARDKHLVLPQESFLQESWYGVGKTPGHREWEGHAEYREQLIIKEEEAEKATARKKLEEYLARLDNKLQEDIKDKFINEDEIRIIEEILKTNKKWLEENKSADVWDYERIMSSVEKSLKPIFSQPRYKHHEQLRAQRLSTEAETQPTLIGRSLDWLKSMMTRVETHNESKSKIKTENEIYLKFIINDYKDTIIPKKDKLLSDINKAIVRDGVYLGISGNPNTYIEDKENIEQIFIDLSSLYDKLIEESEKIKETELLKRNKGFKKILREYSDLNDLIVDEIESIYLSYKFDEIEGFEGEQPGNFKKAVWWVVDIYNEFRMTDEERDEQKRAAKHYKRRNEEEAGEKAWEARRHKTRIQSAKKNKFWSDNKSKINDKAKNLIERELMKKQIEGVVNAFDIYNRYSPPHKNFLRHCKKGWLDNIINNYETEYGSGNCFSVAEPNKIQDIRDKIDIFSESYSPIGLKTGIDSVFTEYPDPKAIEGIFYQADHGSNLKQNWIETALRIKNYVEEIPNINKLYKEKHDEVTLENKLKLFALLKITIDLGINAYNAHKKYMDEILGTTDEIKQKTAIALLFKAQLFLNLLYHKDDEYNLEEKSYIYGIGGSMGQKLQPININWGDRNRIECTLYYSGKSNVRAGN